MSRYPSTGRDQPSILGRVSRQAITASGLVCVHAFRSHMLSGEIIRAPRCGYLHTIAIFSSSIEWEANLVGQVLMAGAYGNRNRRV